MEMGLGSSWLAEGCPGAALKRSQCAVLSIVVNWFPVMSPGAGSRHEGRFPDLAECSRGAKGSV